MTQVMTCLLTAFTFSFSDVNGIVFEQPSFVSDWRKIRSQSEQYSDILFYHGLNVLPYKVITEVMVVSNNEKYIFNGMGSSYKDDDENTPYGGVLYMYNETVVRVVAPKKTAQSSLGLAIYTGDRRWEGPNNVERSFEEALVRVKIWLPCDFPEPAFVNDWTPINVHDKTTFKEINHSLGEYPDLVVVQVKGLKSYVAEAEGSSSRLIQKQQYNQFGGVIYGFSRKAFRIWYPTASKLTYNESIFIYGYADGWGNDTVQGTTKGHFRIIAWFGISEYTEVIRSPISKEEILLHSKNNETYISVEVEALDGANFGFRFYGVGSTVNNGDLGAFGGLVYAYSDTKVVFWIPNNHNGHIINIDGVYRPSYTQASDNVAMVVKIFNVSSEGQCCKSENASFPNTQAVISGYKYRDTATYTCQYGYNYTEGDMHRTCMINGTWNGTDPVCSICICPCGLNNEELSQEEFENELGKLKLSKKTLSKAKRALISVKDDRTSAVAIGYLGITIVILIISFIILPDLLSVSAYLLEKFRRFFHNPG